ncbi:hypothetical protein JCM8547_007649 [Rhodosporidiobolus lusitaniae]
MPVPPGFGTNGQPRQQHQQHPPQPLQYVPYGPLPNAPAHSQQYQQQQQHPVQQQNGTNGFSHSRPQPPTFPVLGGAVAPSSAQSNGGLGAMGALAAAASAAHPGQGGTAPVQQQQQQQGQQGGATIAEIAAALANAPSSSSSGAPSAPAPSSSSAVIPAPPVIPPTSNGSSLPPLPPPSAAPDSNGGRSKRVPIPSSRALSALQGTNALYGAPSSGLVPIHSTFKSSASPGLSSSSHQSSLPHPPTHGYPSPSPHSQSTSLPPPQQYGWHALNSFSGVSASKPKRATKPSAKAASMTAQAQAQALAMAAAQREQAAMNGQGVYGGAKGKGKGKGKGKAGASGGGGLGGGVRLANGGVGPTPAFPFALPPLPALPSGLPALPPLPSTSGGLGLPIPPAVGTGAGGAGGGLGGLGGGLDFLLSAATAAFGAADGGEGGVGAGAGEGEDGEGDEDDDDDVPELDRAEYDAAEEEQKPVLPVPPAEHGHELGGEEDAECEMEDVDAEGEYFEEFDAAYALSNGFGAPGSQGLPLPPLGGEGEGEGKQTGQGQPARKKAKKGGRKSRARGTGAGKGAGKGKGGKGGKGKGGAGKGSGEGEGSENGGEGGGKGKEGEKTVAPPPAHPGYILQTLTCANKAQSNPLASILGLVPKCHECTTRRTGYSCLFRNIRSFPMDPENNNLPVPVAYFLATREEDDVPSFSTSFDRPFTPSDAALIKSTAATHLLPTLRAELAHALKPNCPKIKRELALTSSCDACAHALVCGSWLCSCCGRELCFACAEMIDAVVANEEDERRKEVAEEWVKEGNREEDLPEWEETPYSYGEPAEEIKKKANELALPTLHKLRLCMRSRHPKHNPVDLVPLTRISADELKRVVEAMEKWVEEHPELNPPRTREELEGEAGKLDEEWVRSHEVMVDGEEGRRSRAVLTVPGQILPPRMDGGRVKREWEGEVKKEEHDGEDEGLKEEGRKHEDEEDEDWTVVDAVASSSSPFSGGPAPSVDLDAASSSYPTPAGTLPTSSPSSLPSHLSLDPPPSLLNPSLTTPLDSHNPSLTLFRRLWSRGAPFVVTLSPSSPPSGWPSLPWTPEYFTTHYGSERVTVGSNRPPAVPPPGLGLAPPMREPGTSGVGGAAAASEGEKTERERETMRLEALKGEERKSTVGEFFETFGMRGVPVEEGGRENGVSEKIKDWPPAHDFKNKYPELWEDFMSTMPAGSITRRDGVLNLSSHSPMNANPPDLGPKGYFSHISDDKEGGWGSTKLHMDVADAVNLMVWASPGPDGSPGVAVWDLYRMEDADKIREFLYEKIAITEGYKGGGEEAKTKHDDPIHTQEFFLDHALRRELYERSGVVSWRIHQRPGDVVFIPAGCAHQVCNFADCIKVASDFVSVENVGRCWAVTEEFRHQTRHKDLWRSDVLQLKSALLWAWYSAERFDPITPEEAQRLRETLPVEEKPMPSEEEVREDERQPEEGGVAMEVQQDGMMEGEGGGEGGVLFRQVGEFAGQQDAHVNAGVGGGVEGMQLDA